jgi:hypothetical protein
VHGKRTTEARSSTEGHGEDCERGMQKQIRIEIEITIEMRIKNKIRIMIKRRRTSVRS